MEAQKSAPKKIRCVRDVDYVTAGEAYTVERSARATFFRNVRTGGATSVPNWQFDQAVSTGAFVVEVE